MQTPLDPDRHDDSVRSADGSALEVDRDRLVALVDGLERDIALIDSAMTHVEMREFTSANAALDVLDGVSSA